MRWRAGSRRSDRLTAGGEREREGGGEGPVPVKVVKIWDTRMECLHALTLCIFPWHFKTGREGQDLFS